MVALGELLPPVVAELRGNISDFQAKMALARKELQDTSEQGSSKLQALQGAGKAALFGLGGAAVAAGVFGIKMADDYEQAHARLESAFKAAGTSVGAFSKQLDAGRSSFENLGFSHDQYEGALARLTQATNNPKMAIADMGVVANLAAARHMSLEQAATIVGKVAEGNTSVLKRYGIDLGIASGGASKLAAAQDQLKKAGEAAASIQEKINSGHLKGQAAADAARKAYENLEAAQRKVNGATDAGASGVAALGARFKDSAAAQARTFHGELKVLEAKLKDAGIAIGTWLIPKLQELLKWVMQGVHWLTEHKTVLIALGAVIGGIILVAIGAFIAAFIAANAVVIGIGVAIGALVVAVLWVADNWKSIWATIKDPVEMAWGFIKPIVDRIINLGKDLVQFFSDLFSGNWSALWDDFTSIIGDSIGIAIQWFVALPVKLLALVADIGSWLLQKGAELVWGLLQGIVAKVADVYVWFYYTLPMTILGLLGNAASWLLGKGLDIIGGLWNGLTSAFDGVVSWFGGLPGAILGAIGNLASTLWSAGDDLITGLWNGMKSAWNWMADKLTVDIGGGSFMGVDLPEATIHFLPHLAKGIENFAGGLALVGDAGPEVVGLPRGSSVMSNSEMRDAIGGDHDDKQGGGHHIEQHFHGITNEAQLARRAAREMTWALKTA